MPETQTRTYIDRKITASSESAAGSGPFSWDQRFHMMMTLMPVSNFLPPYEWWLNRRERNDTRQRAGNGVAEKHEMRRRAVRRSLVVAE